MEHEYSNKWSFHGHDVIECKTCGFMHLHPKPTKEQLNQFYGNQYWTHVNSYNENHITSLKNSVMHNSDYRNTYQTLEKHKKFDEVTLKKMLDIGCGQSLLQLYFKNKGWDTFFFEPSLDAYNFLNKFDLQGLNCAIDDIDISQLDKFSFINIQCVLEHILDPVEALKKISQLLVKGGMLHITVPNDFSNAHLAYMDFYKTEPAWIKYPDHISYFQYNTLINILNRYGLHEIYRTTNFPLDLLLLSGNDFYNNQDARSKVSGIINNFVSSHCTTGREEELNKLYENFAQLGYGRLIDLFLIRK